MTTKVFPVAIFALAVAIAVALAWSWTEPARAQGDARSVVGTWDVKMKVRRSTCSDVNRGDEIVQSWTVGTPGTPGALTLDATGGGIQTLRYTGQLEDDGVADLQGRFNNGDMAMIELFDDGSGRLRGHRTVGKSSFGNVCMIMMSVKATRAGH